MKDSYILKWEFGIVLLFGVPFLIVWLVAFLHAWEGAASCNLWIDLAEITF